MTTGVSSPPKSRRQIKEADQEYRRTQLHVLEQCTPGEWFGPEENDPRMETVFKSLAAEGFLTDIGNSRYVVTAKGQVQRRRLGRWGWRQRARDNAHWLIPTFVAISSVVVAALGLASKSTG